MAEEQRRNAPRFKNIAYGNLELRNPDGSVFETLRGGQVVIGEQYRPWVGNGMGFLKWLNKPTVDDREIIIDTSRR